MGVDIETYGARIEGTLLENKMESAVLKKRQESFQPEFGLCV
jgi:hypothetical protein